MLYPIITIPGVYYQLGVYINTFAMARACESNSNLLQCMNVTVCIIKWDYVVKKQAPRHSLKRALNE